VTSKTSLWALGVIAVAILAGVLVSFVIFPSSIVRDQVEVPALRGIASDQAITELAAAGLRGRLAGELADPLTPAGTISWQSPVAGTSLPESAIVRLGVSSGPPRVLMPELVDLEVEAAGRVLAAAGLRVAGIDSVYSATPAGVLLGTRPEARQPIRAGGGVELIVSRGPRNRQ
jgi:serine/threonine-protein kinase